MDGYELDFNFLSFIQSGQTMHSGQNWLQVMACFWVL